MDANEATSSRKFVSKYVPSHNVAVIDLTFYILLNPGEKIVLCW
jgi:hypothetical protein